MEMSHDTTLVFVNYSITTSPNYYQKAYFYVKLVKVEIIQKNDCLKCSHLRDTKNICTFLKIC